MKNHIIYLLTLYLVFQSCTHNNNNQWDKAQHDSSYSQDTTTINKILLRISENEFTNPDTTIKYLNIAEELSKKILYEEGYAKTLFLRGNIYYSENNYNSALENYSQSLQIAEKSGNTLLKAQCLERIASVNLSLGDDYLAFKLYYEALALYEQLGNKEGIAGVYNVIGMQKSRQGEYDTAQAYLARAMQLNEEIGNKAGLIHNKANLAYIYRDLGMNDKAQELYNELIPQLIETGDSTNLATVYYHFSIFFQWISKPDSALVYLHKAMEITKKTGDNTLFPTLYGMTGLILLEKDQRDSASYYLNKSIDLAKDVNDYFTQAQALKLLLNLDTLKGDYHKAAGKLGKILEMNDSVFEQRLRNNLEASELRYENQKKSNLIAIQNIEIKSAEKQKQFLLSFFIFSVFISLLLILLIILIKRNNKRKQELLAEKLRINELELVNARQDEEISKLKITNAEKELSIRESELVSNALAVEQKNELLGQINNKLNEAMAGDGTLRLKDLNGIVSAIRSQVNETDTFNQKFNQLHHNFFDGLKMSHPLLTKSEMKFCAYLKLHLNSNQIASITNVTLEAIRKTRYRVRKKLNLPAEESLEDYISRF